MNLKRTSLFQSKRNLHFNWLSEDKDLFQLVSRIALLSRALLHNNHLK